jgi:hypothetical protein
MDSSVRNRTVRRSLSPPVYSPQQSATLESFLDSNASQAFRRPWHRLEWGLRMNRLRRFVDKETQRLSLSDTDNAELLSLLLRALKNKKLNSKTTVVYDLNDEEIKEIKGLVYHTTADGRVKSELLEKKGAVTFRRRGVAAATGAATGNATSTATDS